MKHKEAAVILKYAVFSSFRYSSEQRWRHNDVNIDVIPMFLTPEYWSYPKVILYKIWVVWPERQRSYRVEVELPPGTTPAKKALYE